MLSASRCVGAVKPRRGSLERLQLVFPSSDSNAPLFAERVYNTDATTPVGGAISSVPPSPEFGMVEAHSAAASHTNHALFARSSQQTRGFHTSPQASFDSTSYNVAGVPDFFVKYKQQRATLTGSEPHGRKNEPMGLMPTLADSILAGDVLASTRRLRAKIPIEHEVPEGHVVHSSGFVVPGPGHTSTSDVARAKERERCEHKDLALQTKAVAHRVSESDLEQVAATTLPNKHKIPFEVREQDGTFKHPSGFMPPTPEHMFRYHVNVVRDRKVSDTRKKARQPSPDARKNVRQPSPARAVLRAMHTSSQ